MAGRLLRHVALLGGAVLVVGVAKRSVDVRRRERRLAEPVPPWPDVPLDDDRPSS